MGFYHRISKCCVVCAMLCGLGHRQIQLVKEHTHAAIEHITKKERNETRKKDVL